MGEGVTTPPNPNPSAASSSNDRFVAPGHFFSGGGSGGQRQFSTCGVLRILSDGKWPQSTHAGEPAAATTVMDLAGSIRESAIARGLDFVEHAVWVFFLSSQRCSLSAEWRTRCRWWW